MTARKPYVNVAGQTSELPDGDTIADPALAAIDQFYGDPITNVAQIETNTLAARVTLRDPRGDGYLDFRKSSHSLGIAFTCPATTTWTANSDVLTAINLHPMVCAVRRVGLSCATSAFSGTRAGGARIQLHEIHNCISAPNTGVWLSPRNNNVNGISETSLRNNNGSSPQLIISCSTNNVAPNGIVFPTGGLGPGFPTYGEVDFGVKAAIETHVPPCWLYDCKPGETPILIPQSRGLYLNSTFPAASVSQTIAFGVTIQWDEWQPILPI